jgi:hypothetical protein
VTVLVLYTEAAQIDARTKKAMVAAGYLPVRVASMDAVKIVEAIPAGLMGVTMGALVDCVAANPASTVAHGWGQYLAKRLLDAEKQAKGEE